MKGFLRSSLVWLALGVGLGVALAFEPSWIGRRPAHAHANVFGFVGMMIFGVAYHVLPRFAGRPLPSRRVAVWHLWVQNAGLALLLAGWLLTGVWDAWPWLLRSGAVVSAAGVAMFIGNVWGVLRGGPAPVRLGSRPREGGG